MSSGSARKYTPDVRELTCGSVSEWVVKLPDALEHHIGSRSGLTSFFGIACGWAVGRQSSRANTKAAKSTSRVGSRSRSRVVVPGLNDAVHGSTCAMSSSPRVSACSSFACFADEPRKMRGSVSQSPECELTLKKCRELGTSG